MRGRFSMSKQSGELSEQKESFCDSVFSGMKKYIELREIGADGKASRKFYKVSELKEYVPPADKNVYVGIFERNTKKSGRTENCSKTQALWVDFDDVTLMEVRYRIDMENLPSPSMIVSSGNGYHVYWILNQEAGHEVQPLLKKLAQRLKADERATDIPRIMRLPGTNNVKGDVTPCELIQPDNGERVSLKQLENVLGVKAQVEQHRHTASIKELSEVKFNGLHNMALGVSKGERNFCTGRIVQTLKRLNYTKREVEDIVFRWNQLNDPIKPVKELKADIKNFWYDNTEDDRLRYDGKEFSDEVKQELNERFIDNDTKFFKSDEVDSHHYDNELLHPDRFKNISGLTFAVLSIIKQAESEGIRREHIADLCNRNKNDNKLREILKSLDKMGYIKARTKKQVKYYYFTEKANYNRGFTSVPKLLHEVFLGNRLKEQEYKMMILLESYAHDNKKEIFPSNSHLAFRSGQSVRTVIRILKQLDHKQYIKFDVSKGKRHIRLIHR